jgi:coproporphyrinogen III oxidase-like Fe-S oxidoreductase
MTDSDAMLTAESPFFGYSYSYPHKSAYRRLSPPVPLDKAWQRERRDALFLYLHVPFCEFRCGFCNLFTLANAEAGWTAAYLRQLRAEAAAVRSSLGDARFARMAIGGGTPTYLSCQELGELLEIAGMLLGGAATNIPVSCEASPATLSPEKARLLKQRGVDRISLGVQTFDDAESRRFGRPQSATEVHRAIAAVREMSFRVLNLDLIYGAQEQSLAAWLETIAAAIDNRPEEIYLYPLYIRELTGLGRIRATASDDRLVHYREARAALLGAGFQQTSLRMFQRRSAGACEGPHYCCQTDGMIGLGCGARSYTQALHYSTEFAVGRGGVRTILKDYLSREQGEFFAAQHGYVLDVDDQRRRYVIQSLLQSEGITWSGYRQRFGGDFLTDLPQLQELLPLGLASTTPDRFQLTTSGLERSDAIGPWLYSHRVRRLMEDFRCL